MHHPSRLVALFFFVWCASPSLCLEIRPQSSPAAPSEPNVTAALIASGAAVLVALITSVTSLIISQRAAKTSQATKEVVQIKISLNELLEPKNIDATIAAIQDRRHFVSEDHILGALMKESLTPAWAEFRSKTLDERLVSGMVGKAVAENIDAIKKHGGFVCEGGILAPLMKESLTPAWDRFVSMILFQLQASQVAQKPPAEQRDLYQKMFALLAPLLKGDSGAMPDDPGQAPVPRPKRSRPPKLGNS